MDSVTKALVEEFSTSNGTTDLAEDKRFEHFATYCIFVTSRQVVRLFLEQLWFEFVPFLHRLQGRLAAQG